MARETYEVWGQRRLPRWLRGTWIDKTTSLLFGQADLVYQAARDASSVWFLTAAPDDVVERLAASRLLERISGESLGAYRARAVAAWGFWSELGTTTGLRDALRDYIGTTALEVYSVNEELDDWLGAPPPIGLNSDEDTNPDNWSRHAIVIPATHPWVRQAVGSTLTVGPDLMVGLSMTETELKRIRRIYRKHRPAHMCGIEVYVVMDATSAASILVDHTAGQCVRLALGPAPMVGYLSHGMIVGPTLVVGQPIT